LAGNQTSVTNANGDSMSYEYDKLNRLIVVKDSYSEIIEKRIYDAKGNTIKKMDAKGILSAMKYRREKRYELYC
jgi:YD repeat-containing protein